MLPGQMRIALLACLALAACGDDTGTWLIEPRVLVPGVGVTATDCRTAVCKHNENTDLTAWDGAIYLVHRTAESQVLGPNSSLRVLRSDDGGASFAHLATIAAPTAATRPDLGDRDLRDPHFLVIGGQLAIKALVRLPVRSTRDTGVDTVSVVTTSPDGGRTWTPLARIGPPGWGFWRSRVHDGVHYAGAYEDGDLRIRLFSSPDGLTWTAGAVVFDVAADTPLEPELVFLPSGRLLVFFRLDGSDAEILGAEGRLRTQVCWAEPPYDRFDCPQVLDGVRLDGPVAFWHRERLFVVARKHVLGLDNRKRTSLYELTGALAGGPLGVVDHGDLPSAGDTAYAGVVPVGADRWLVSWYASDLAADSPWVLAIFEASDVWLATLDLAAL